MPKNLRKYHVRVLVSDGHPGLIPFNWHLPANSRDEAISIVRKRIRNRNMVVKYVDSARLAPVQF